MLDLMVSITFHQRLIGDFTVSKGQQMHNVFASSETLLGSPSKIPSLKPNTQLQDTLGVITTVIAGLDVACSILAVVGVL